MSNKEAIDDIIDGLFQGNKDSIAQLQRIVQEARQAFKAKEYDKALKYFQSLSTYDKNHIGYLFSVGLCYQTLGKYDLAIQMFTKVIEQMQDNTKKSEISYQLAHAYYQRGMSHYSLSHATLAKKDFLTALQSKFLDKDLQKGIELHLGSID